MLFWLRVALVNDRFFRSDRCARLLALALKRSLYAIPTAGNEFCCRKLYWRIWPALVRHLDDRVIS